MHEFDLSDPDQRNQAAAEYVLGTLEPSKKAQFEALLAVSTDTQLEVEQWKEYLDILNASLEPVPPPAGLWKKISAKTKPAHQKFSLWNWPSLTAMSLMLVMTVGLLFQLNQQPENVYVYLIKNEQQQPGWVMNTSLEENQLVVESLRHVDMPENTFYEAWLMIKDREPVSLGFLPTKGSRRIDIDPSWLPAMMDTEIVVTMEGVHGAPSGWDMGPVSDRAKWSRIEL